MGYPQRGVRFLRCSSQPHPQNFFVVNVLAKQRDFMRVALVVCDVDRAGDKRIVLANFTDANCLDIVN